MLYLVSVYRWIMNADAWNGDPHIADFLVEPDFVGNIERNAGGGITMYLAPPSDTSRLDNPGIGCRISTTSYLDYGVFTARLTSGAPAGMVTSFISMSDVRDEIDYEWVGGSPLDAQTTYFYRGNVSVF